MNTTLEKLQDCGCDIKGSLSRFLDDENFMLECIISVSEDPCFKILGEALLNNKPEEAFNAAHTLKGILGNTGLTPLYDVTVQIVEPLRAGNISGLDRIYSTLMEKLTELKAILQKQ